MQGDDQEKIACLKRGDPKGARFLVDTYAPRLYNAVYRIVRREHDAEEVVQETLIKAYYAIATFRGESSLFTWLYRIAFNLAVTRLKREKRHATLPLEEPPAHGEPPEPLAIPDSSHDPAQILTRKELGKLLDAAIATLPDSQRQVFLMKEVDGLSYEEIAALLKVSVELARTHLHRARLRLMRILAPQLKAGERT